MSELGTPVPVTGPAPEADSRQGGPGHQHRSAHPAGIGAVKPVDWVYANAPMIIYWEITTACGLACRHCRATAMPDPEPTDLDTHEALRLLAHIATFPQPLPHVVLTGGDPLRRADLDLLLERARELGIGISLAPAVTPLLTRERLAQVQRGGVQAISLSLDGSDAARHDGLRGVPGTFEATLAALDWASELGLPVQVNTLVTEATAPDLPALYDLLRTRTLQRWSLFFLISVGRGSELVELAPGPGERLMHWLLDIAAEAPFQVKTTEAMSYRRVAARAMRRRGLSDAQIEASPMARGFGIRDGNGILFIAQDGTITPSGFLPLALGNVRTDDLATVYREHPDLIALRDVTRFSGRCGRCSYAKWCGGSRARAYAWTGDPLAADPLCPYEPDSEAATGHQGTPTSSAAPARRHT